MDYSKLSTEDLVALKNGNYSKISTEGLMVLKGQKAPTTREQIEAEDKPLQPLDPFQTIGTVSKAGGELTAEKLGEKGHPVLGGIAGGLVEMAPDIAVGMGAGKVARAGLKGLAPLARSAESAGARVGEALGKKGLERAEETVMEPRNRKAILEYFQGLKPTEKMSPEELKGVFEPQGLVQKYDELGRILEHSNVAKASKDPKQIVSKKTLRDISNLKSKFGEAIKSISPDIEKAMSEAALTYKKDALIKALAKKAGLGAGAGIAGALGYGGYKLGKALLP